MNKLRKIGLTALAGSLVASSVYAGELSVSGSWSLSYGTEDSDEVTGNPWSMGDSVNFTGSGETDQGYTIGVTYELDGGTYIDWREKKYSHCIPWKQNSVCRNGFLGRGPMTLKQTRILSVLTRKKVSGI